MQGTEGPNERKLRAELEATIDARVEAAIDKALQSVNDNISCDRAKR